MFMHSFHVILLMLLSSLLIRFLFFCPWMVSSDMILHLCLLLCSSVFKICDGLFRFMFSLNRWVWISMWWNWTNRMRENFKWSQSFVAQLVCTSNFWAVGYPPKYWLFWLLPNHGLRMVPSVLLPTCYPGPPPRPKRLPMICSYRIMCLTLYLN